MTTQLKTYLLIVLFVLGISEDIKAQQFSALYNFPNLINNTGTAVLMQADDGKLYGTTAGGGLNNSGAIYRINLDGSGFTNIFSFGTVYGAPERPLSGLLQGKDGNLYGTQLFDGNYGFGGIYRIATNGSGYLMLHSFNGTTEGGESESALIQGRDGRLYGCIPYVNPPLDESVYAFNPADNNFTILHTFSPTNSQDGRALLFSLLQSSNGMLYGVAEIGGSNNLGTLFTMNTNGGGFSVLHHFSTNDGTFGFPISAPIEGADGNLYGTASSSLYRVSTNGSNFQVLHTFIKQSDGSAANALVQGIDGKLYGTTAGSGSAVSDGMVFSINLDGTGFTKLHSFTNGADGANPICALLQANNGVLYGTTTSGGTNNGGSILVWPYNRG